MQTNKQKKTSITINILTIILALSCFTFQLGYRAAARPGAATEEAIWEPGTQVGEASYVIWREGSSYYVRDGTTGAVQYSGTNASQIIQNAIDDLYATAGAGDTKFGGTVYVKKGGGILGTESDYEIDSALQMKNRVNLIGEKDATLKATQNLDPALISLEYSAPTNLNLRIDGFRLEGNHLSDSGIVLTNCSGNIALENLEIGGFDSYGIDFRGAWGVTVRNVKVWCHLNGYGIRMRRQVGSTTANNLNTFHYAYVYGDGIGVYIDGDAYGNSFIKSHITAEKLGVRIAGDGTYIPTLTHFLDCWFERGGAITNERAIEIIDVGSYVTKPRQTIIENSHFGVYDIAIFVQYARNTTIKHNYFAGIDTNDINIASTSEDTLIEGGYYDAGIGDYGVGTVYQGMGFQDSGTAEASNDDWIAHNLWNTPDVIILTVQESDARYIAQVKAKNTTHFQLYLYDETAGAAETTDQTISWLAEYWP